MPEQFPHEQSYKSSKKREWTKMYFSPFISYICSKLTLSCLSFSMAWYHNTCIISFITFFVCSTQFANFHTVLTAPYYYITLNFPSKERQKIRLCLRLFALREMKSFYCSVCFWLAFEADFFSVYLLFYTIILREKIWFKLLSVFNID